MSTTEQAFQSDKDQSPPSKKRSFLQRLNKRHGTLSLHMRSKRGGKVARSRDERSSTHSRNTSASQNEVSEPPSLISSSTSDRNYSEIGSRYYDIDDDLSPTTPTFSVGVEPESEFEVPIQYVVARNDKDGNQEFVKGMQDFMHRREASNTSAPSCPTYAPPLPPDQQRRPKSNSSEMSDEQMEKWLQPEDADLHRERKSSENLNLKVQEEAQKSSGVRTEEAKAESKEEKRDAVSSAYLDGWNMDPEDEGKSEEGPVPKEVHVKGSCPKKGVRRVAFSQDESQGLLSLPNELLRQIEAHLDTSSAWFFRLSCKRLYNKMPASSPPSSTDEELISFFSKIQSLIPEDLTFCAECKKYHPWTLDDYYIIDSRRRGRIQRCRRHLNAKSEQEVLGPGRFLCETCNTSRSGKKCKTCAKCEHCARLKRSWMLMTWVEDECDYCAASHSPKWKHYKGEFEGRLNPGEYREWTGV